MSDENYRANLPASLAPAIAGIPAALVPASVKALDRLLGAAVDLPVAWLEQQTAKIKAKTASFEAVEGAVASSVAGSIASDKDVIDAATVALLRKEYKKRKNLEAVGAAMLEDLSSYNINNESTAPHVDIDEDWLNVFERYAETASSDRMQKLWGRVISGEVRKPGKFSLRTLRFLSEFSQSDALVFSDFCNNCFGQFAPMSLAKPDGSDDIGHLIDLESAGLVQGASSPGGLSVTIRANELGNAFLIEGSLAVLLKAAPGTPLTFSAITLTPLGQELLSLLPQRDQMQTAERVATAIRTAATDGCCICVVAPGTGQLRPMKMLWQNDASTADAKP